MIADPEPAPTLPDDPNHPQPKTKKRKRKRSARKKAPHPEGDDHDPVDGGSVPVQIQQQADVNEARQTALATVSAPPPEALSLRLGTAIPSDACADQGYQLVPSKERQTIWRISNPMGGRIADIDPILTQGDKYLILSYYTSIQVYSTEDSLLVRRIPIPGWPSTVSPPPVVVATRQSRVSPNLLWVATSDGHILQIDWTIPPGMAGSCLNMVRTESQTCRAMAVLAIPFGKHKDEDVLIVAENDPKKRSETSVHAYRTAATSNSNAMWCELGLLSVEADDRGCIPVVETSQDGLIVAVALAQTIYVASLAGVRGKKSFASWHFQSYTFDGSDLICALDLRISDRPGLSGPDRAHVPVVDLIAGGARGAIFLYNDVLARLTKPGSARDNLQARKLHWHRRAVHALKWSRDGNYMISGGSENALVIWQMDTGQRDYLPHLAASVENIAVSADGSSYLVHLDDNSVMVLSTAELKPTVYVAGLQSGVRMSSPRKDELVRRVWSTTAKKATKAGGPAAAAVTAAINPKDPLKLHLCVGSGQQGSTVFSDPTAPAPTPWLQSFDLASFRTDTRQAIARTHATENNITSDGYPIRDPTVTHMQFSADGRWLATADEWEPAPRDVADMSEIGRSVLVQQRREVYLKFWQVNAGADEPLGLVSRISAPHSTDHAEPVLDLVAAPKSTKFATVAGDGIVRLWRPVAREQDGIRVKDGKGKDMHRWICSRAVDLGSPHETELLLPPSPQPESTSLKPSEEGGVRSRIVGSLAFSEDGSILFAALGGETGDGAVRLIDADSGRVRHTIRALWRGSICRMASLSSYLMVVSDRLVSYSILTGQRVYSIELPPLRTYAERNLVQLAVDRTLGRVGVVVPNGNRSDMGIFQPDNGKDAFMHTLPHTVLCTIAAPGGSGLSGFLMLDDAAQLSTVSAPSEHEPIQVLRPLEDIRLADGISGADAGSGSMPLPIQVEMEVDDEIASEDGGGQAGDDEDVDGGDMDEAADPVVVSREGLASIFSTAPAFAMPPIDDLFFKVAALVGQKPAEVYRAGQAEVGAGVASSGVDRSGRSASAVA